MGITFPRQRRSLAARIDFQHPGHEIVGTKLLPQEKTSGQARIDFDNDWLGVFIVRQQQIEPDVTTQTGDQ